MTHDDLVVQLKEDVKELKQDVKGIFQILAKQEGLIEIVNQLQKENNRIYKSHSEICNRLREIEGSKADVRDLKELENIIDTLIEQKLSKKDLGLILTAVMVVFTVISIIIQSVFRY